MTFNFKEIKVWNGDCAEMHCFPFSFVDIKWHRKMIFCFTVHFRPMMRSVWSFPCNARTVEKRRYQGKRLELLAGFQDFSQSPYDPQFRYDQESFISTFMLMHYSDVVSLASFCLSVQWSCKVLRQVKDNVSIQRSGLQVCGRYSYTIK